MAGRIIDADKLKAHYAWWKGGTREITMDEAKSDFDCIIDLQPTVELKPIMIDGEEYLTGADYNAYLKGYADGREELVKHGHWIGIDDFPHETWECDRCGKIIETDEPPNYCENCGARMIGEVENG